MPLQQSDDNRTPGPPLAHYANVAHVARIYDYLLGPGAYMRITPEISWSLNLAGQPYGSGSGSRQTVHCG